MMGGGLYNTSLQGSRLGGDPLRRPARPAQRRPGPDVRRRAGGDHVVVGVSTSIKTDFKMKNLVGRGSGESVQMAFQGQGWVLVQPSEGRITAADLQQGSSSGGGLGNLLNG
jgi:uncharacterized protein (AIM24 family)